MVVMRERVDAERLPPRPRIRGLVRGLAYGPVVAIVFGASMMGMTFAMRPPPYHMDKGDPPLWVLGMILGALYFGPIVGLVYGALLGICVKSNGSPVGGAVRGGTIGGISGAALGGLLLAAILWNKIDSPFLQETGQVKLHPPYWVMGAPKGAFLGLVLGWPLGTIIGALVRSNAPFTRKTIRGATLGILLGVTTGWIVQTVWWHHVDPLMHGWWKGKSPFSEERREQLQERTRHAGVTPAKRARAGLEDWLRQPQ